MKKIFLFIQAWRYYRKQGMGVIATLKCARMAFMLQKDLSRNIHQYLDLRTEIGHPIKNNEDGVKAISNMVTTTLDEFCSKVGAPIGMISVKNVNIDQDRRNVVFEFDGPGTILEKLKNANERSLT